MAHHSSDGFPPGLAKALFDEPRFGATGQYPDGHYTDADEGEIQFGLAADKAAGKVIIDFGKPVAWIGMLPAQARELAALLVAKADICDGKIGG